MKVKIFVIAALVAILAVAAWMARERPVEPQKGSGEIHGCMQPDLNGGSLRPIPMALEQVVKITLASPEGREYAILEKRESGWIIGNLYSAPAAADKIDTLLKLLLAAETASLPEPDRIDRTKLGLDGGNGIDVFLSDGEERQVQGLADGGEQRIHWRIGLRPSDDYDAAYASLVGLFSPVIFKGDIRGAMGLWQNTVDAKPDPRYWLETRVFPFDPEAVTSVVATYPDHRLSFTLGENGDWGMDGEAPGDEWSPTGLAEWVRELSAFRIASVADSADLALADLESPSHRLEVAFKGGGSKSIRLCPDRTGDGMWAETSDYPGRAFFLPMWRFKLYFQRLGELFPKASPTFDAADVRLVDIRRGGENVKIVRRDADWRAPSIPFPLRQEQVQRLVRALADWRAEDYFEPGKDTTIRVAYGGPIVEVVLVDGSVHRYRLGGRHPVFPWRYVILDGEVCLAGDEERTMRLFPAFAEIFELGLVFSEIVAGDVSSMEFSQNNGAEVLFLANRREDGSWKGSSAVGALELTADDIDRIVWKPLTWQASGLFEEDARGGQMPHGMFRIRFAAKDGREELVTLLSPHGRDIPYLNARGRAMRVSLGDFLSWTRAIRDFDQRVRHTPPPRSEPEENETPDDVIDSGNLSDAIGDMEGAASEEEGVGFVGTAEIGDWTGAGDSARETDTDTYAGMLGAAMAEEDGASKKEDGADGTETNDAAEEEAPGDEPGNAVATDDAADSTHHVIVAE